MNNPFNSLEDFLNESKKKPVNKKEKELDKLDKVDLKKRDSSEQERKQTKKKKKAVKESLNENYNIIEIEELINWLNNDFSLMINKITNLTEQQDFIIDFIDKHGVTLENFIDIITSYYDEVDDFSKKMIDKILELLESIETMDSENEDLDESVNEIYNYDKIEEEQSMYQEINKDINDVWLNVLSPMQIGNVLNKLSKKYLSY